MAVNPALDDGDGVTGGEVGDDELLEPTVDLVAVLGTNGVVELDRPLRRGTSRCGRPDPPLLNVVGVHQPWALRAIVEVHTDSGLLGLGETYADETHLGRLEAAVAAVLPGQDLYDLHGMRRLVTEVLGRGTGGGGASFGGMLNVLSTVDTVYCPFEVACLDVVGHEVGRPVSDLLGGAVRDRVPF